MRITFLKQGNEVLIEDASPSILDIETLVKNVLFLINVKASHKGMLLNDKQYYNCDYSAVLYGLQNNLYTIQI